MGSFADRKATSTSNHTTSSPQVFRKRPARPAKKNENETQLIIKNRTKIELHQSLKRLRNKAGKPSFVLPWASSQSNRSCKDFGVVWNGTTTGLRRFFEKSKAPLGVELVCLLFFLLTFRSTWFCRSMWCFTGSIDAFLQYQWMFSLHSVHVFCFCQCKCLVPFEAAKVRHHQKVAPPGLKTSSYSRSSRSLRDCQCLGTLMAAPYPPCPRPPCLGCHEVECKLPEALTQLLAEGSVCCLFVVLVWQLFWECRKKWETWCKKWID